MLNLRFVRALGVGVVALALMAHVWMFDTTDAHGPADVPAATTAFAAATPLAVSGCAAGMSACEVPMPADPLVTVFVAGLLAFVLFLDVARRDLGAAPTGVGRSTERAPPQRPPSASSVVLLV